MPPDRNTNSVFLAFLLLAIIVAGARGGVLLTERTRLLAEAEQRLALHATLLGALDTERLHTAVTLLQAVGERVSAAQIVDPGALPSELVRELPQSLALLTVARSYDTATALSAIAPDGQWQLWARDDRTPIIGTGRLGNSAVLVLAQPLDGTPDLELLATLTMHAFAFDPGLGSAPEHRLWLTDGAARVLLGSDDPAPPEPGAAGWLRKEAESESYGLSRIAAVPVSSVLESWLASVYFWLAAVIIVLLIIGTGYRISIRSSARRRAYERQSRARLLQLVQASNQISRGRSRKGVFERAARLARELIPAHQAMASETGNSSGDQLVQALAVSDRYSTRNEAATMLSGDGLYRLALDQGGPIRLNRSELERHPLNLHANEGDGDTPLQGWLAAPILSRDGRSLGLLQLSNRVEGEFTEEDEAMLQQLASVTAAAVEQSQVLEALQASRLAAEQARDEYARLLETLGEVYIAVDAQLRIIYLNRAAEELYGVRAADFRDRPLAELDPETAREMIARQFQRVLDAKELVRFTWQHERLNRVFEVHSFPTPTGFAALLDDITDRQAIEEQLRQAQKMEIVGQLTGGVAHDFNNLLTVIIGQIELLTHDRNANLADRDIRDGLELIAQASQRAADLTQRLLAFARRQTLNPTVVDPGALLAQIEPLLRRSIGETVAVEVVPGGALWNVEIDVNQFDNAILNLALNARDAMPKGGQLAIEAKNVRIDEHDVDAHAGVAAGEYVMLAVTDTGDGMEAEVAARAFEPFFTTKEVGAGSGLGLSMVYGFLRQSGGHVKIQSEPGTGTTVRLYMPRHLGSRPTVEKNPIPEPSELPTGRESILLVEDDDLVRGFVSRSLDQLGYRVLPVADGPAALAILESGRRFDMLLTDVVLPGGMSGSQVAESALRRQPKLKILYASGYNDDAVAHDGRLDPDLAFIGKPFSQAQLAAKVRQVLDA